MISREARLQFEAMLLLLFLIQQIEIPKKRTTTDVKTTEIIMIHRPGLATSSC